MFCLSKPNNKSTLSKLIQTFVILLTHVKFQFIVFLWWHIGMNVGLPYSVI